MSEPESDYDRAAREFLARQHEAKAAVWVFAEGWARTLRNKAAAAGKVGRCFCDPPRPVEAGELQHPSENCLVMVYLRLARLMQAEADEQRR